MTTPSTASTATGSKRPAEPLQGQPVKKKQVVIETFCPETDPYAVKIKTSDGVFCSMNRMVLHAGSNVFRDMFEMPARAKDTTVDVAETWQEIFPLFNLLAKHSIELCSSLDVEKEPKDRHTIYKDNDGWNVWNGPLSGDELTDVHECECGCGIYVAGKAVDSVHEEVKAVRQLLRLIDKYDCRSCLSCIGIHLEHLLRLATGHTWPILALAVEYKWEHIALTAINANFEWVRSDLQFQYLPACMKPEMIDAVGPKAFRIYQRLFIEQDIFRPEDLEKLDSIQLCDFLVL